MKEKAGSVFSLAAEYEPQPGCTESGELFASKYGSAIVFSLAAGTEISPETYAQEKMIVLLQGTLQVLEPQADSNPKLQAEEAILIPGNTLTGFQTGSGAVYLEITLNTGHFNEALPVNRSFVLKDLIPVRENRIVNMDLGSNPGMKFVLMTFDRNTGLSEHAAPGDALIFALSGKGIIGYEGKDYALKTSENFKFAAGGRHTVSADGPFVMALLMELPAFSEC